ncbi:hypothetical protein [Hymenobacter persicinus]|uniref:Uncharacterized protein n=1 Tax=Hymenobacter persicinus TaxID=2025506 RepID=A0A4Q5LE98_9BACT|nr:hypothetical protein [Hymenobacter persicinus]RYU78723.1 hypothetical protein EWM57_13075 [Hymenobacter persicinus]
MLVKALALPVPPAASSHRPYSSRRKRRRSSSTSPKLSSNFTMGLLGLLLVALVVSLGIIAFSMSGKEEEVSYEAVQPMAAPPTALADSTPQ